MNLLELRTFGQGSYLQQKTVLAVLCKLFSEAMQYEAKSDKNLYIFTMNKKGGEIGNYAKKLVKIWQILRNFIRVT